MLIVVGLAFVGFPLSLTVAVTTPTTVVFVVGAKLVFTTFTIFRRSQDCISERVIVSVKPVGPTALGLVSPSAVGID